MSRRVRSPRAATHAQHRGGYGVVEHRVASLLSLLLVFLALPSSSGRTAAPVPAGAHSVSVERLPVEARSDVVINTHTPRFHWRLSHPAQSAFELQVAHSSIDWTLVDRQATAASLLPDLLISGVSWSPTPAARYKGPPLTSDTRYAFRIRYALDEDAALWSAWFYGGFRTGLFSPADWTGQWIGGGSANLNQLRTSFTIPTSAAITSATVFLCGLGYHALDVNGAPVDPTRRLDPGWTLYQKRSLYVSFDLTRLLHPGVNAIGVTLGHGWYDRQLWLIGPGARPELSDDYGPVRVLLQLNVQLSTNRTLTVVSDGSWMGREAEHRSDSVYMGSLVDLRAARPSYTSAAFVDPTPTWMNVSVLPSPLEPAGVLALQSFPPIRVGPTNLHVATSPSPLFPSAIALPGIDGAPVVGSSLLHPISESFSNGQLYDVGQTMAGYCSLTNQSLPRGFVVQVRYAERTYSEGANGMPWNGLDAENLQTLSATDTFVLAGTGNETLEPAFTYHGFRYVLVTGLADDVPLQHVQCFPVHSETTLIGNFSSSSAVLNQLQHNMLWSQLSNTMSLPTDCPQRNERRGWLGDAALSVDFALSSFDLAALYEAFVQQIADAQDASGGVPDTVPFTVGNVPADPNWGTAVVTIPWALYEHTGDVSVLQEHYEGMKGWVDCMLAYEAQHGLAGFYSTWGDWLNVGRGTNASLVASFPVLRDVRTFSLIARLLNDSVNAEAYNRTYQRLAVEWHSVWYRPDLVGYGDGSQAGNALSLMLPGVVPDSLRILVAGNLVKDVLRKGHFDSVGIVSIAQLFPALSSTGHHDVALQLIQQTSYPSFGHMFNNPIQNATTVWESFNTLPDDSGNSLNHHMFNSVGAWMYRYVAGIVPHGDHIRIHPRLSKDPDLLRRVTAETVVGAGRVRVDWEREDSGEQAEGAVLRLSVEVPNGGRATLVLDGVAGQRGALCQRVEKDGAVMWLRGEGVQREAAAGLSAWEEDVGSGSVSAQIAPGVHHLRALWSPATAASPDHLS